MSSLQARHSQMSIQAQALRQYDEKARLRFELPVPSGRHRIYSNDPSMQMRLHCQADQHTQQCVEQAGNDHLSRTIRQTDPEPMKLHKRVDDITSTARPGRSNSFSSIISKRMRSCQLHIHSAEQRSTEIPQASTWRITDDGTSKQNLFANEVYLGSMHCHKPANTRRACAVAPSEASIDGGEPRLEAVHSGPELLPRALPAPPTGPVTCRHMPMRPLIRPMWSESNAVERS